MTCSSVLEQVALPATWRVNTNCEVRCGSLWTHIHSEEVFLKEFLTNRLFPQVPQTDVLLISTSATSGVFFNVLILN